jgi:argininosuccinate synthase
MERSISMENKKLVLAYSGGLDTSVAVKWLSEKGFDVIAACMDVGEGKDLNFIQQKALKVGAVESIVLDCKAEFAEQFVGVALKGI